MREYKYRMETFYLFDHTGIQRHLEEMAARGWLLDKLGPLWRYRRIEPQALHFAVTYFPEASVYDPEPREGQWDYQELCRDAGWTHAATQGQMQIFYTEAEDPVPLETDPQLQVENIHRAMWRSTLASALGMLGISLLQMWMQWRTYSRDPIDWLCGTSGAMACLCWITVLALNLLNLADYLRWHRQAQAAAREGRFTPTFSRRRFQIAMLTLVFAALLLWAISSITGSRLGTLSVLYGLAMLIVVGGVTTAVNKILKHQKASAMTNRWGTTLAAVLSVLVFFGWSTAEIINGVGRGWFEDSQVVETYTVYGMTREVYGDPIPLRIEDLMDTDYDRWSTEAETYASPVMVQHVYSQECRTGDPAQPQLFYKVVEVKWPALYDTAEDALRKSAERYNNPDFPEFWSYYAPTDPAPWGALRAYQLQEGGEPQRYYLLCYEDHLTLIQFLSWEEELTPAQMAKVREVLG